VRVGESWLQYAIVGILGSDSSAGQSCDLVYCIRWCHHLHVNVYILRSTPKTCLLRPNRWWALLLLFHSHFCENVNTGKCF